MVCKKCGAALQEGTQICANCGASLSERNTQKTGKKAARKAGRTKKIAIFAAVLACAAIAFLIVLKTTIIPNGKYNDAMALKDEGHYEEAIAAFEAMDGYKDSEAQMESCKAAIVDQSYNDAVAWMNAGEYEKAIATFEALGGYKDSAAQIENCKTAALDEKYNTAIAMMDSGDFVAAYEALAALDGYKDSAEMASSIYDRYNAEKLRAAKAGDTVFFGTYEQDNDTSNGKEAIEWLVLDVKDGMLLVISKYALDCQPYHTKYTDITWDACALRKWLNSTFLTTAFSAEEQAMIPTVTVSADQNPSYSTDQGDATRDPVFLLSITEFKQYYSAGYTMACQPTEYALAQGASVNSSNGYCWWWLRSSGESQTGAAVVGSSGGVNEFGAAVSDDDNAVRPVLWIDPRLRQ